MNGVAPGGTVGTDLRGPRSLGLDGQRLDDRPGRAEQLAGAHAAARRAHRRRPRRRVRVPGVGPGAVGMTGEILRSDGGLGVR